MLLWLPDCAIKSNSTWFPLLRHTGDLIWDFFLRLCVLVLESFVAAGQLVEKLLIESVALRTTACRHENVSSNKLMNDFAVSSHTGKSNVDVAFKLNSHLEESETHKVKEKQI